jgi:menaquinol-cytochrome c reductase iron-sulfur subunit
MTNQPHHRRGFLGLCTSALLGVLGLVGAIPVFRYVGAPFRRKGGGSEGADSFVDLGPVDDLPVGEWRLVPLEMVRQDGWEKVRQQHAVWVRRMGDSEPEITVLSPICPHLGCPINWRPDQSQFLCPCHGGVFSPQGRTLGGPPPRSMDPLPLQVRNGRLLVRWGDFKIGVDQRIPVQA